MLTKEDLGRLLEYTVWANHRVMRVAPRSLPTISSATSVSTGVSGHPDPHDGAEWIWLERFKGVSPTRGLDESEFAASSSCATGGRSSSSTRRLVSVAAGTGHRCPCRLPDAAGAAFEARCGAAAARSQPRDYHRGQVVALLRQLGARTVSTDMLFWIVKTSRGRCVAPPDPRALRGSESERSEDPLAQLHEVEARSNPASRAAVTAAGLRAVELLTRTLVVGVGGFLAPPPGTSRGCSIAGCPRLSLGDVRDQRDRLLRHFGFLPCWWRSAWCSVRRAPLPDGRILGGYTTFSTFGYERSRSCARAASPGAFNVLGQVALAWSRCGRCGRARVLP